MSFSSVISSLFSPKRDEDILEVSIFAKDEWYTEANHGSLCSGIDVGIYDFVKYYNKYNEEVILDEYIDEFILHPRQRLVVSAGLSVKGKGAYRIMGVLNSHLSISHGICLLNALDLDPLNVYLVLTNLSNSSYTFKRNSIIGYIAMLPNVWIRPIFV